MLLGGMPADIAQHKLTGQFAAAGIAPDRLTFHPRGCMESYLALHHQTDICLDAYPYTGGTTTYHALWMGVPTLTVAGSTPPGRQGAAILAQIGLEDFIAADGSDFVRRGVHWAANPAALAEIRSGLRSRLADSSSQQPELIVAALEGALRQMWRRWCDGLAPESFEINHPHSNGTKTP
jgi:predicted O-linked N-acetylglucosamine transferase (SPINDLY family)